MKTDPGVEWAAEYVIQRSGKNPVEMEERVDVTDKSGKLLTFGYLDARWQSDMWDIADLKTGNVREYKPQLIVYALATMQDKGVDEVRCHELYSEIKWANSYVVTRDECERLVNKVVTSKRNPTKSPNPCEYCSWCKHQLYCTAVNHSALTVAERTEEVVEKYHPSAVTSPLMLSRMLTVANALDGWIKAVKQKSKEMEEMPGYRKVNRKGRPAVKDLSTAFLKSGMSADEFLSACTLSLDKLAKVEAERKDVDVKAARREIEETLGDLIEQGHPIQYWSK